MRISSASSATLRAGYALVLVMVFTGFSMLILGGALSWSATNSTLTDRNNQYMIAVAAAEAATEKVVAHMWYDFQTGDDGVVRDNLSSYRTAPPSSAEAESWANFEFSDGEGHTGQTHADFLAAKYTTTNVFEDLDTKYAGMKGFVTSYAVVSNVRQPASRYPNLVGAVRQEVQVASIPVFQFAIFYAIDLEINPGVDMDITGRVHSNAEIYTEPNGGSDLTFLSDVSAVGALHKSKKPGDPTNRGSSYNVVYNGEHDERVASLTLPIGTNNSPDAVHAVLEVPPAGEDKNSAMGKQRYYNNADLVILVSNNVMVAKSGGYNNFATIIPTNQFTNIVYGTNFYDKRESRTVKALVLDVAKFKLWNDQATNMLKPTFSSARDISSVYIADFRTNSATSMPGIQIINGQTLPDDGLTVASPDPIYVRGHYNAPAAALGTTNTLLTKPASLVGDAITLLSGNWTNNATSDALAARVANSTTVNAAIIAGNVPTGLNNNYSGGVENFPRLLENWGSKTLTYNGSMVVMFNSKIATNFWRDPGTTYNVYGAPTRRWAFDVNFMDSTKLPPGTPQLRRIIRSQWQVVEKNKI